MVLTFQLTLKTGRQRKHRHFWQACLLDNKGQVLAEVENPETLYFLPNPILILDEWAPDEEFTSEDEEGVLQMFFHIYKRVFYFSKTPNMDHHV